MSRREACAARWERAGSFGLSVSCHPDGGCGRRARLFENATLSRLFGNKARLAFPGGKVTADAHSYSARSQIAAIMRMRATGFGHARED